MQEEPKRRSSTSEPEVGVAAQSEPLTTDPRRLPEGREEAGAQEQSQDFPDYRFTLANERTFLAYVRTALALDAGGLAVAQFIRHPRVEAFSLGLAVVLTALGLVVAVLGYRRWRRAERAINAGRALPPLQIPLLIASGLAVASLAALVIAVAGR